jgi:hypothetical protein
MVCGVSAFWHVRVERTAESTSKKFVHLIGIVSSRLDFGPFGSHSQAAAGRWSQSGFLLPPARMDISRFFRTRGSSPAPVASTPKPLPGVALHVAPAWAGWLRRQAAASSSSATVASSSSAAAASTAPPATVPRPIVLRSGEKRELGRGKDGLADPHMSVRHCQVRATPTGLELDTLARHDVVVVQMFGSGGGQETRRRLKRGGGDDATAALRVGDRVYMALSPTSDIYGELLPSIRNVLCLEVHAATNQQLRERAPPPRVLPGAAVAVSSPGDAPGGAPATAVAAVAASSSSSSSNSSGNSVTPSWSQGPGSYGSQSPSPGLSRSPPPSSLGAARAVGTVADRVAPAAAATTAATTAAVASAALPRALASAPARTPQRAGVHGEGGNIVPPRAAAAAAAAAATAPTVARASSGASEPASTQDQRGRSTQQSIAAAAATTTSSTDCAIDGAGAGDQAAAGGSPARQYVHVEGKFAPAGFDGGLALVVTDEVSQRQQPLPPLRTAAAAAICGFCVVFSRLCGVVRASAGSVSM